MHLCWPAVGVKIVCLFPWPYIFDEFHSLTFSCTCSCMFDSDGQATAGDEKDGIHLVPDQVNCCTAREAVQKLLTMRDELQLKAGLLLNNWWHERNKIREGATRRSIDDIAMLSGRQATEIMQLQKKPENAGGIDISRKRWEKPPCGFLKVNVDGAFRDSDKERRLGLCHPRRMGCSNSVMFWKSGIHNQPFTH